MIDSQRTGIFIGERGQKMLAKCMITAPMACFDVSKNLEKTKESESLLSSVLFLYYFTIILN